MSYEGYNKEIQIEIEDVYSCLGSCAGCTLSASERKTKNAVMSPLTLTQSIKKLKDYIVTLKDFEKISLTYGIADHFLMSKEYLANSYNLGASLIETVNLVNYNSYNGIFYTASMIGKHKTIMDKVKFLYELSQKRNIPIYLFVVLDPKHLYNNKKFSDIYKKNIIETSKFISKINLTITFSKETVDFISPQDLYEFALINNFNNVTINWTPTFDNLSFVYMDQNKLADWLLDFDRLIGNDKKISSNYRPVIIRTVNHTKCKLPKQQYSFQEIIKHNIPKLIYRSIQIDDKGNIFPKYEAIGDMTYTPRLGYKPIGNVSEELGIEDMFERHINAIKSHITKQFVKEPCNACEYNLYCANSGFHIYNYVLNKAAKNDMNIAMLLKNNIEKNNCPHVAKKMFKYYEEICDGLDINLCSLC